MSPQTLAPIALFVFKRPHHTSRTLRSLASNPEFLQSPLYVFCDGPRRPNEEAGVAEVRGLIRRFSHPDKTMVERDSNLGLARSIIAGVTDLCQRFGRVIVVEDDLSVSPAFLRYMNDGLTRYEQAADVMQICGHMFPVKLESKFDAVMLPLTTSWGWATWARAWAQFDETGAGYAALRADPERRRRFDLDGAYPAFRMLEQQRCGRVDSWAIRWYLSVFSAGGMGLFPVRSMVSNEGFDGSGTNCGPEDDVPVVLTAERVTTFPPVEIDRGALEAVSAHLLSLRSPVRRLARFVRRLSFRK